MVKSLLKAPAPPGADNIMEQQLGVVLVKKIEWGLLFLFSACKCTGTFAT